MKWVTAIIAAMVLAFAAAQYTIHQKNASPQGEGAFYRVVYVYDGDTIKLDNGERVRLIGIDTPESHDSPKLERDIKKSKMDRQVILAMGERAATFSRNLLLNQHVRLEMDVEPRDRYQRLLAYVYLADGTFVNEKIIREGYASPLTVPPNVRHADEFKEWFKEARENKRGLWND